MIASGIVSAADIASADWSLALDGSAGNGPGSGIGLVVEGLSDIAQCIGIILLTVPGEDPFRPTFGCDITQYIDKPLPIAQAALTGLVTNAVQFWEPRVKVQRVIAALAPDNPGGLQVTVIWSLNLGAGAPSSVVGASITVNIGGVLAGVMMIGALGQPESGPFLLGGSLVGALPAPG